MEVAKKAAPTLGLKVRGIEVAAPDRPPRAFAIAIKGQAAGFVDKIFKCANPADMPVEQPTKFELVIYMKTARALGLTLLQEVLLQAERLFE